MLEVAFEYPVNIKRTTFKYRNSKNAPDEFEKQALHYLEKKQKAGRVFQRITFRK
jgi:hypothetical protein